MRIIIYENYVVGATVAATVVEAAAAAVEAAA